MLFKKCNGGESINADCAGELIDPHCKLPRQLFLGNAANRRIALIHRDVAQVVELAKDRKLAELGNAGDKDELQVFVTGFERCIELAHDGAKGPQRLFVVHCVKKRRIVLVHQYHRLTGRLGTRSVNETEQARARSHKARFAPKGLLAAPQHDV